MACVPLPDGPVLLTLPGAGAALADPPAVSGTVVVSLDADRVRVVLSGEVDIACSPQTQAACTLAERSSLPVVVDASRVSFLDAAALGSLVRLRRAAQGGWTLQRPSPVVLRMLELTDLGHLLEAWVPDAARL